MVNSLKHFVKTLLPFLVAQVLIGRTQGQLLAKDVREGSCLSQVELLPHLYRGVNTWTMTAGDYYIKMASKALYAEGLLGRPAATPEELEGMQLELKRESSFSTIRNMGYPYMKQSPTFRQTCIPGGLPSFQNLGTMTSGKYNLDYVQATCIGMPARRPNGRMALEASASFIATVDSIVWVNPQGTAFLTYRCPANGLKDYKVVSKTKSLEALDIEQIKEKILPLGLHEDHIAFMKYD